MATAHLIHGYLCSGKTTFAKELEQRTGGVRFSLDEWMTALTDDAVHLDDALYERLYGITMGLWPRIVERGLDVILDFGFWTRRRRDEARAAAAAVGSPARLYLVQSPDDIARARCRERNRRPGADYRISDEAFDALRSKFQPLGPDEEHEEIEIG
jgi:predicted kinase